MPDDEPQPDQNRPRALNWLFALAILFVASAIAIVAWQCMDSVHKRVDRPSDHQASKDEKPVDLRSLAQAAGPEDLTGAFTAEHAVRQGLIKLSDSELVFARAIKSIEQKDYAQAETDLTQVLALIPVEAGKKISWNSLGQYSDQRVYTAFAYQNRAFCHLQMRKYDLAIADLSQAIKLRPGYAASYENRAKAYMLIGQRELAAADMKVFSELSHSEQMPP